MRFRRSDARDRGDHSLEQRSYIFVVLRDIWSEGGAVLFAQ